MRLRTAHSGDKRGGLGDKAPTDVGIGQHFGAMVASQYVAKASTQRGNTQSQFGGGAASGATPATGQFVELLQLVERGCMQNAQRVVGGFEVQWEVSVAAALSNMQAEFRRVAECVGLLQGDVFGWASLLPSRVGVQGCSRKGLQLASQRKGAGSCPPWK